MKNLLIVALLSGLAWPAAAQTTPNLRLKHELDSLYEVDQRYRAKLFDPRQLLKAGGIGLVVDALGPDLLAAEQKA